MMAVMEQTNAPIESLETRRAVSRTDAQALYEATVAQFKALPAIANDLGAQRRFRAIVLMVKAADAVYAEPAQSTAKKSARPVPETETQDEDDMNDAADPAATAAAIDARRKAYERQLFAVARARRVAGMVPLPEYGAIPMDGTDSPLAAISQPDAA